MPLTIRLAIRDWDYLTPIALGDVRSPDLDIELDRVGTLISHVGKQDRYDGAETSFSGYSRARAQGDETLVGIPNFIMRGFRHRCIIVMRDSPLTRIADLAGKRIGLTGWPDSGNTWTRAILRREGVGVEDAIWFAGRLTEAHPVTDRLSGYGRPGRIEACPGERPMVDLMREGELDAIFTPFMPVGFFDEGSDMRPLLPDVRGAEIAYMHDVGYVPGMHLVSLKAEYARANPWVARVLSDLLDESQRMWLEKRRKYADTTPWIIDEIARTARDLPEDWNVSGLAPNERMIADFSGELHAQGILPRPLTPAELFPGQ